MNSAWIGGADEDGYVGIEVDPTFQESAQRIYDAGAGFVSLQEAADFAAAGREAHANTLATERAAIYAAGYHIEAGDHETARVGSPLDRSAR